MVEFVSPTRAAHRYAARASIEVARSMPSASYRGGIAMRTSAPWEHSTSYRGGSIRDRQDLGSMRDRARTVYRENAIGRSLLNTETDNVVAEGFTLQMASASEDFNKEAVDRFYKWLETADVAGKASASDLFRMSWREPRKDGDGGFLLIKQGGRPKLQYIPGDLIRNPYGKFDYRTMFSGVECDPSGRAVRFWVRDVDQWGKDVSSPVDARDFIWIAHLDDPMAIRGGTVYGPIFELLDQIDSYRDSVTKAAILACLFGLIEKRRNPGTVVSQFGLEQNSQGTQQKAITLEAGMLKVLGTDESVFQVQASQPMQQTPEFLRALSRIAAIGFDMPLEVALRDLSQVNFSGGQLGMKGYERTCRVRQDWLKSQCWNRVTFWWLSVERQRQALGFADAFKTPFPADYGNFELHPREWLLRDRLGEAKADLMEIAIGVSSPQRACAQRSVDHRQISVERETAWKASESAGLPNVLPTETRDATLKVTAVDADGNPIAGGGGNSPLNGAQIAAAMDVLTKVREQKVPPEAATEFLAGMGIDRARATALVAKIPIGLGNGAGDVEFKRDVLKSLLTVPQARESVYNATDITDLVVTTGLKAEPGYQPPYAVVVAPAGDLNSGAVIRDPQGDVVGGDIENNMDGAATADANKSASEPGPAGNGVGDGNGQQEQQANPPQDNPKP